MTKKNKYFFNHFFERIERDSFIVLIEFNFLSGLISTKL